MYECVVYILCCFGRSLKEDQFVSSGELEALIIADLSLTFQVFLVADKDDGHPVVGVLQHFFKPSDQILERVSSGDIVD